MKPSRRPWPFVFALAGGVAACSTSSPIGPTLENSTVSTAPVLTSLPISAPATNVLVGGTLQLTAAPSDQKASPITATVAWSSSKTNVATINSSTGLLTGVGAGITVITARSGTIQNSMAVLVGSAGAFPSNATVTATTASTFTPSKVDVLAGGTVQFAFQSLTHNITFSTGTPASIADRSNTTVSVTFTAAGTSSFVCSIHPTMNGSVVVH